MAVRTLALTDIDTKQPLIHVPGALLTSFGPEETIAVDFYQLPSLIELDATFSQEQTASFAHFKRYLLVRHHRGQWFSVPKPWLRNIGATAQDTLEITDLEDRMRIKLVRAC